jgi:exosome complex RNA-binding protein Rrp4
VRVPRVPDHTLSLCLTAACMHRTVRTVIEVTPREVAEAGVYQTLAMDFVHGRQEEVSAAHFALAIGARKVSASRHVQWTPTHSRADGMKNRTAYAAGDAVALELNSFKDKREITRSSDMSATMGDVMGDEEGPVVGGEQTHEQQASGGGVGCAGGERQATGAEPWFESSV